VVEPIHLKNMQQSNWVQLPQINRGENKKCLSCHHVGNFGRQSFNFLDPQSSWTLDLDFLSLLICLAKEMKNNAPFCIFGEHCQIQKMTAGTTNTKSFGKQKRKVKEACSWQ